MEPVVLSRGLAVLTVLVVLLGGFGLGGFGLAAPAALAHTALTAATPRPGQTVDRLDAVRLVFGLPLAQGARHSVQVFDPAGTRRDTGSVVETGQSVSVAVAADLAATGEYVVRWCVVASDGHPQSGAYEFSYSGPVAAVPRAPAPAPDNPDCAASATNDTAASVAGWLLLALIVASALYIVIAAIHRRRRPRTAGGHRL